MAERPEDLNLPNAVVTRIIKESLPDGINVAKEARAAIARAASVFILYSTTCANNVAIKSNRKTITGQDVIQAMTDMEFEKFVDPLKQYLEGFKKGLKDKKEATAKRLKEKEQTAPAGEGSSDEQAEEKENEVEENDEDAE